MILYQIQVADEVITSSDLSKIQAFGKNYETVEVEDELIHVQTRTVKEQMDFGDKLRLIFNEDNRNTPIPFSVGLAQAIYTKFQTVEFLCRNGDLKNTKQLIFDMPVDPVFTQERKEKYILLINNFMNFVE